MVWLVMGGIVSRVSSFPSGDVIVVELMSGMLVFSHCALCMAFLAVAEVMERLVMNLGGANGAPGD